MGQQHSTRFSYRRHPDQDLTGSAIAEHDVAIVGAGPVGLSIAIDLAQRGQSVVVLDDDDRIGDGFYMRPTSVEPDQWRRRDPNASSPGWAHPITKREGLVRRYGSSCALSWPR